MEVWSSKLYKKTAKIVLKVALLFFSVVIITIVVDYIRFNDYAKVDLTIEVNDHYEENTYVYYTYNDQYFDMVPLVTYDSSWRVGQTIIGYVNPSNPSDVVALIDLMIIPIIFLLISIIPFFIYLFFLIASNYSLSFRKKMLAKGKKVIAHVDAFENTTEIMQSFLSDNAFLKQKSKDKPFRICASHQKKKYYSTLLLGDVEKWKAKILEEEYAIDVYLYKNRNYVDHKSIHLGVFY